MQNIRTIHIGSDHAGFEMKEAIREFLESEGYDVIDHGAFEYDEDDDYPDYIAPVASAISLDPERQSRGIILGGSGQGEAILANRFTNVRAIVFNGQYEAGDRDVPEEIITARQHNDANIISLGARFLSNREAIDAVLQFLETDFSGEERHIRRIQKIDQVVGFYSQHNQDNEESYF